MANPVRPFAYHLLVWLAFIAITFLSNLNQALENHSIPVLIWKYVAFYGINAGFFYLHYSFLIPKYLNQKRFKRYSLFTCLSILTFPVFHYLLYLFNFFFLFEEESLHALSATYYFSFLSSVLIYLIAAIAIRFAVDNWRNRQKARELEQAKTQAELNFLKTQVNPHFLFNAFNTLYALSLRKDQKLPQVILKLSDLMRYIMDYSEKNQTTLSEEVRIIENYLEIQRMRLDQNFDLQFNQQGPVEESDIIPLAFLPLVENCFKHSDLSMDGFVHINLVVEDQTIFFSTKNQIRESKSKHQMGSGLVNLKRRLTLIYQDQFQLETGYNGQIFGTFLKIPAYVN